MIAVKSGDARGTLAITLTSITRCSAGVKALRVLAASFDRAFRPASGLDAACAPRGHGAYVMAMGTGVVVRGQLRHSREILVQRARLDP
jgi:hypothetical protein